MDRRKFIQSSGLSFGLAATISPFVSSCSPESSKAETPTENGDFDPASWASVRSQFRLDHSHIQMAQMLLASHPKPVSDQIQKHRDAYDANPATYWEDHFQTAEIEIARTAAKYMGVKWEEVALTDSTTMGTAILLNGMKLQPGDEILATTHDHYVTDMSIDYACEKKGATVRRIDEYKDPRTVTVDEVATTIEQQISEKTRVVMVTWVQSCTGVKLPIKAIAEVIARINTDRDADKRIYFAVDGVHGFGNQDENIGELGCDFFSAGTHKWIFGPRGTGVLYGKEGAWDFVEPTIPAFSQYPYQKWMGVPVTGPGTWHELMSPGGFHAFDHRWSLGKAFEFQMEMGRDHVHQRTTQLNTRLKEQLKATPGVDLITPMDPNLSAGINCFMVDGKSELETLDLLHGKGIIASTSPYAVSYARLTPCVINTEEEVDRSVAAVSEIA